jgi:hypothetical protein
MKKIWRNIMILDNLNDFKLHRNNISESLTTTLIGRDIEIEEMCQLLNKYDYIAITGPSGVGKTRFAVAVIEKYVELNFNIIPLCVNNFGDYISQIDEKIDDSKKYILLFDDANKFSKLNEIIELLKYKNIGNIKVIFTIRDYLEKYLDFLQLNFYELKPLSDEKIKEAIESNTPIKNQKWLNKITDVSNGNIRMAFIISDYAINDEKGFNSLFNVKDILNSYYKNYLLGISEFENLVITLGIISFFNSINLQELYYLMPLLKMVGLSKKEFLENVNKLINLEMLDEILNVVRISDQCFKDYILYYTLIEKRYIKIKDLIVNGYKYYEKRIIESLNTLLNISLTKDLVSYIEKEIIEACDLIENIDIKHKLIASLSPLIMDYAVIEFKNGIESYSDKKDITWLIGIYQILAKTNYCSIATKGIIKLLNKTENKKDFIYKALENTLVIDNECVNNKFQYLMTFINYIFEFNIVDDFFYKLVSSYLEYSFDSSKFIDNGNLTFYRIELNDNMDGICEFRKICWLYIFKFDVEMVNDIIVECAKNHFINNNLNIIKNDISLINEYLKFKPNEEIFKIIIYEEFKEELSKYKFNELLLEKSELKELLDIILKKDNEKIDIAEFEKKQKDDANKYYLSNGNKTFEMVNKLLPIKAYYFDDIKNFLFNLIGFINEYNDEILNLYIDYYINPLYVVKMLINLIGYNKTYDTISLIEDKSIKDEYLYNFYTLIDVDKIDNTFNFNKWLNSKIDVDTVSKYNRNALKLKSVAVKSGITYLDLIKTIFKKRKYNEQIVKEYLSYLFIEKDKFQELLELDCNLAINIYEFLNEKGMTDYRFSLLNSIIAVKKNYIKNFAKRSIEKEIDIDDIDKILNNESDYKMFLDECFETEENENHFVAFTLCKFISKNINNQFIENWILNYICDNYKKDNKMESLFSTLANIDEENRNKYIVSYYKKGKNSNILKAALSNRIESYSSNESQKYYNNKIGYLEKLKKDLIEYDNVEFINFINDLINEYNENIKADKIEQLYERVDSSILDELKELDQKTDICLKDAFELYLKDEKFRNMLSSGNVSYKNGYFVNNNDEILKFESELENRKIIGIKLVPTYTNDRVEYEKDLDSMDFIIKKFSESRNPSICECIRQLIIERKWEVEDFERETFLSRDFYSKIKNNKSNKFEKRILMKLLIGLKVPKNQRNYLLELNGTILSQYNVDDALYSFILESQMDIDFADELLHELKKEELLK